MQQKKRFFMSDDAALRLKQIFTESKKQAPKLRILVDSGGCSGFQYSYEIAEDIQEDDICYIFSDGVEVVIDSVSMNFLEGAKLDYISNLGGAYFKIENPNSKQNCGCGNSFNV